MTQRRILVSLALAACAAEPPADGAGSSSSATTLAGSEGDSGTSSGGAEGSSSGGTVVVLELLPTDDATVDNQAPDDNFGGDDILEVENDPPRIQASYLRFVVDDIEGEILGASLRLLATEGSDYGGDVFAVDDGDPQMGMQWTEDTLTFNNAAPVQGDPIDSVVSVPSASYVVFDVTSAVALATSHSFAITTISEDEIEYSSKEGVDPPLLVVTVMTP
ncbi:MAG TPA: DNRLRE domain-containing protein [Nannocystaceae bacterium]|nr:DNRLRE domain-containing protein [Nannocystaceae bacterium]